MTNNTDFKKIKFCGQMEQGFYIAYISHTILGLRLPEYLLFSPTFKFQYQQLGPLQFFLIHPLSFLSYICFRFFSLFWHLYLLSFHFLPRIGCPFPSLHTIFYVINLMYFGFLLLSHYLSLCLAQQRAFIV